MVEILTSVMNDGAETLLCYEKIIVKNFRGSFTVVESSELLLFLIEKYEILFAIQYIRTTQC